jgi:tRNA G10  N-methylase Trm11
MYIFQLGRDGDISTLELIRVLNSQLGRLPQIATLGNFVIMHDEVELDAEEIMAILGGTLKIAKVFHSSDDFDPNFVSTIDFYFPKSFELHIASNYQSIAKQALDVLNDFKKQNKLRGSIVISDDLKVKPFAGEFEKVKDRIGEIIVLKGEKHYYAQVQAYTDTNEFKFKDEARPVQKFTHGTSFRLAKMMVNILDLQPDETLIDPFCGIGTFLIEGMLAGLNVIGIDNDEVVIRGARKNVAWAKQTYQLTKECEIRCADSTHEVYAADGCVFEPYMGPFMKKLPGLYEAQKVKQKLETLFTLTFRNLRKNLRENGEVVCIIPYFATYEGEMITIDERVFRENGFEPVIEPIDYKTPDGSIIQRKLWLLQKK